MPNRWDWVFVDPVKAAIAGMAGGLVRWITLRENPKEGLIAIVLGGVCAVFLSPAAEPIIVPILSIVTPDQAARDLVPFIIGLGGIGLTGYLIDVITRRIPPKDGGASNGQS